MEPNRFALAIASVLLFFVFIFSATISDFLQNTQSSFFASSQSVNSQLAQVAGGSGNTYFVSSTGSNSNPGTIDSPFATIRYGMGFLHSGDTLFIRGGTYAESFVNDMPFDNSAATTTCTDVQTCQANITIAAYNGEEVIIRPSSGTFVFNFALPKYSYVVLDGLTIDGASTTIDAIKITYSTSNRSNSAHHIWIRNSKIRNAACQGILVTGAVGKNTFSGLEVFHNGFHCGGGLTWSQRHGIYLAANDNIVEFSKIYDNSGYGIHIYDSDAPISGNIVRYNLAYDNGSGKPTERRAGIILSSGPNHEAYGNILWGNASGIDVYYGGAEAITNVSIHGNTIYRNLGTYIDDPQSPDPTVTYSNNTFINIDVPNPIPPVPTGITTTYTLVVANEGTGSGTITGTGINCGADCSEVVNAGTLITLTATPASGSTFTGWTGGCAGTGSCSVTLNSDTQVSAVFDSNPPGTYSLSVAKSGAGTGVVTGTDIDCGADCLAILDSGTSVTLSASSSPGSIFTGWSGGNCIGTGTCTVILDGDTTVVASFEILNNPPVVSAGPDQNVTLGTTVLLLGTATDDGLPLGSTLSKLWTKESGPGAVTLSNPNKATTTAIFSMTGTYVLKLTASDSILSTSALVTVSVAPSSIPISVNSTVKTTSSFQVRKKAGMNEGIAGTQPAGASGKVTSGPTNKDGFVWWKVNFTTGVDGWVPAQYLVVVVSGQKI